MTQPLTPATASGPAPDPAVEARRRMRHFKDRLFVVICIVAASMSLIILFVLLASIAVKGFTFLNWNFLTEAPSRKPEEAGIYPAMIGTIFICAICAVVAIPIGVGTAMLLEEFKPKNRWVRHAHGFVQLNITNLAGVPSVVYGILGLTAFVGLFGLFGNANNPAWTFGASFYDVFYDETNRALHLEVSADAELTALSEGMVLKDEETGDAVIVHLHEKAPADPKLGDIVAGSVASRNEDRSWYYVQLPFGRGILTGGLTLMLVVLPVVIIASQEALRAVPDSLRQGAFGLGATRWQTVWNMTLPAAIPGIMTGTILAMSRAIGEAAPILIIAGIVYITFTPQHLMDDFTAMPLQIYDWARRPQEDFHRVAASGIIVLLSVLLTFNAVAIFIRQKFSRPMQ